MLILVLAAALIAAIIYAWRQRLAARKAKGAYDVLYGEFLEAMAVSQSREDMRARTSQLFRESADQVDDLIQRLTRAGAEIERLKGLLRAKSPEPEADGAPSQRELDLRFEVRRLKEALAQAAPDDVWARRYKDAKRRFATTFHPDLLPPNTPDRAARELAFKLFYDDLNAIAAS